MWDLYFNIAHSGDDLFGATIEAVFVSDSLFNLCKPGFFLLNIDCLCFCFSFLFFCF